ncbi:hypothetical protein NQ317_018187 [Molorchus minor]|uniref:Uncharacterized protein n=1 Tax=Molorchus minor TaxID=1323400 RepID=A0ABQ9JZT8_9CUCU|nr:hypothetical protein NQ317_018187 [Molorchus minor]
MDPLDVLVVNTNLSNRLIKTPESFLVPTQIRSFSHQGHINRNMSGVRTLALEPQGKNLYTLGRLQLERGSNRRGPPESLGQLAIALEEDWVNLSPETLQRLIKTMPLRCQAVIQARGAHIFDTEVLLRFVQRWSGYKKRFPPSKKRNLCFEAENLELKLDLEKCSKEVPRLLEQIHHLESYIEVLKNENAVRQLDNPSVPPAAIGSDLKKVSELERTVFMLKRVVEKLQAENKRLVTGKRPIADRASSADKVKRDYARLKEQHEVCLKKLSQLEEETKNSSRPENDNFVALSNELADVKDQLEQKSHLLDKVKILLHRAATKEKALLHEIAELRCQRDAGISPIQEESEDTSSDC